ncbi:MAG TPA: hypothetical protein VIM64_11500, partial [Puia sp.]
MPEVVEEIVGKKAYDQIDALTDRLLKAAGLIDDLNSKGSKMEIDLKGAKTINEAIAGMSALKQNQDALAAANIDYQKTIRDTDKLLVNFGTNLEENIRVQLSMKTELKGVKDEMKNLAKDTDVYGRINERVRDRLVELTKREKELSASIREQEQLIKSQAKANVAAAGSIDQVSAKLDQFKNIFRQLSQAEREGAIGEQLLKSVQELDPTVKGFNATIGDFQRNVGNYAGTFSGAFSVLNTELSEVRTKLAGMSSSDAGFDSLTKQEQALAKITEGLTQAFGSTKQELREFQEAAKQLGLTLGSDSELFAQFVAQVGKAKDELGDLQATVDFNASDTKYLDGTIEGINAVAGAYGVAEGAATLFGASQEDLQRQMVVLQAVMTITNGLQQIQIALQSESALMMTLLSTQTKILAAAKAVEAFIDKLATAATRANTLETIKNRAAKIAATIATGAQTAAMSLYTFVTNGATVATKVLRAALLATGIGAVIVLLGTAISYMSSMSKETDKAASSVRDFSSALENLNDIFDRVNANLERNTKVAIAAAKARGASEEEILAIERKALEARIENLEEQKGILDKNYNDQKQSAENLKKIEQDRVKLTQQIADARAEIQIKEYNTQEQARKKSEQAAKKASDDRKKLLEEELKNTEALQKELAKRRIELLTPSEEEISSMVEDITRIVNSKSGKVYLNAGIAVNQEEVAADLAKVDAATSQKLASIERAYAEGLYKSYKEYEKDKTNATIEGSQARYQVEINGIKKLLAYLPTSISEQLTFNKQLNDLELKQLDETNKLKLDKEKEAAEKRKDVRKKLADYEKQIGEETFQTVVAFINATFEKRRQGLDNEQKQIDRNKESEINAINASMLTQEEKQRRVAEAEIRAAAKTQEIERKKIELQRRQAAFDKAVTIAKIIGDTASAVVEALPNIPLSIAIGVIGALQLARAVAAPLPQFAEGTDNA